MTYSLCGQLPRHLYCWVDSAFTHVTPQGFVRAVWFGLVSFPGRMWGCTVMLESGAVYRNLPPHALAFGEDAPEWKPEQAELWDCYGVDFSVLEYGFLAGLDVKARICGVDESGTYLFTAVPVGDGFSAEPEQAKEFVFVRLDNGRLTIQPTDRVIFADKSFTTTHEFPRGLRRQTDFWCCE